MIVSGADDYVLLFALFILEAKFATHGILGSGGALSMVLGAVMLIDSPVPEMRVHLSTAIALALPFSLITMVLLSLVLRARHNKVVTGSQGMIGEIGTAVTPLDPEGKLFVARDRRKSRDGPQRGSSCILRELGLMVRSLSPPGESPKCG